MALQKKRQSPDLQKRKRRSLLFYIALIALPLIQFGVFYLGVNVNSLLLAFRSYSISEGVRWVGFDNFVSACQDFAQQAYLQRALWNSLLLYATTLLSTFLSLVFSFYLYKKRLFGGFFKVILFLPNIISGLILAVIYKYFVERAIPSIASDWFGQEVNGLLSDNHTALGTLLFFSVFVSFGVQTLIFSGAMEGISPSLADAAAVDGVSPSQEFFHIVIPSIWPDIVTFVVLGVAGIFTNQMSLYTFYDRFADPQFYTLGYFLYKSTLFGDDTTYPYLAAWGLLLTFVAVPLTYLVKFLLERFGPRVD